MPIANNQIQEILDIIAEEVGTYRTLRILNKLKLTKVYRSNQSYRETIDRLAVRHSTTHGGPVQGESVTNVTEEPARPRLRIRRALTQAQEEQREYVRRLLDAKWAEMKGPANAELEP